MNNKHEEKATRWQSHLVSWKQSGLSQLAYCEEHNLKPHQFWYWKRKLDTEDRPRRRPTRPDGSSAFVPVRMATRSTAQSENGITLELPGGARVHGVTADTLGWLRELIRELS